jgi:hypothetical protein
MTQRGERILKRTLWTLYAVLGMGGLACLAAALFVPHPPRPMDLKIPAEASPSPATVLPTPGADLAERRFTRRLRSTAAMPASVTKGPDSNLEQLIRLTGILDFGGKQPTLAVIETLSPIESKAYKVGDRIGETGVRVKDIKEYVIVEYDRRRFKVTFAGVQELPAAALGKD